MTALDIALSKKLYYCTIVLNSFNRQNNKDGFRTPLRPKTKKKFYPSKNDDKSPNTKSDVSPDSPQPNSLKLNPSSKPRSLTSPYPLSDDFSRSFFFNEHRNLKEKIANTDQSTNLDTTELAAVNKELNPKKYRNSLLSDRLRSRDHPQLHLKQTIDLPLAETRKQDEMIPPCVR